MFSTLTKSGIIAMTTLFALSGVGAYSLPFDTVSTYSCSKKNRSDLDHSCKQALPKLHPDDYDKLADDRSYRQLYSVLWGGSYNDGRDYRDGGHTGVDIVTAPGTPIRAIGDGIVVEATSGAAGYGNVVKIKHHDPLHGTIYSLYGHMQDIDVNIGDTLHEGDIIGTVGNTGISTGPHLHREIITTTKYNKPRYAYTDCPIYGRDNRMNLGLCRDYLAMHTMDPLALIYGISDTATSAVHTESATTKTSTIQLENTTDSADTPIHESDRAPIVSTARTTKTDTTVATRSTTTRNNQPLGPSRQRYREQAERNTQRYQQSIQTPLDEAQQTYDAITQLLEDKLPIVENSHLSREAQDFLNKYELEIQGPEQLILTEDSDQVSIRFAWIHKETGSRHRGQPPFDFDFVTLRDKIWLKESDGSDGSRILFLTKRVDGLNIILWTVENKILGAKPILSI